MGLPRSGTAWLSNFLTWGNSFCFHEGLFAHESMDQFERMFRKKKHKFVGDADTAAILISQPIFDRFKTAKYVFVIRDHDDIIRSLDRININSSGIAGMAEHFWRSMEKAPNSLFVRFDNLFNQVSLRKIWSHIGLSDPFPWERTELLRGMHIEDGISSGFGRFVSQDTVRDSKEKFDLLVKSINESNRSDSPVMRLA